MYARPGDTPSTRQVARTPDGAGSRVVGPATEVPARDAVVAGRECEAATVPGLAVATTW